MKQNKLTIQINQPVAEVFEFTLNPVNTPRWIESIVKEEVDASPGLNVRYKNYNQKGETNEYLITEFEPNKFFTMTMVGNDYKVKYTFTPVSENETEVEYFEWSENGELAEPFGHEALEKLREVAEGADFRKKTQTIKTYNESASALAKKFDKTGARVKDIEETFALITEANP